MTTGEAITLIGALRKDLVQKGMPTYAEALGLGIEALNTVKKWREQHRDLGFLLLPGETEED